MLSSSTDDRLRLEALKLVIQLECAKVCTNAEWEDTVARARELAAYIKTGIYPDPATSNEPEVDSSSLGLDTPTHGDNLLPLVS